MKKLAFIGAAIGLICAVPAQAGEAQPGLITLITTTSNGVLLIHSSGTRSTPPACATQASRFALPASTTAQQAAAATLLTAFATGKQVHIVGTGTCHVWGDSESVDYFSVSV